MKLLIKKISSNVDRFGNAPIQQPITMMPGSSITKIIYGPVLSTSDKISTDSTKSYFWLTNKHKYTFED